MNWLFQKSFVRDVVERIHQWWFDFREPYEIEKLLSKHRRNGSRTLGESKDMPVEVPSPKSNQLLIGAQPLVQEQSLSSPLPASSDSTVMQMEKVSLEDGDEYHRLLRQQIREGRQHVFETIQKIRQFDGLVLRPAEAVVGLDGMIMRMQKVQADAQRRAEVRTARSGNNGQSDIIEVKSRVIEGNEPTLPSNSIVRLERQDKAAPQ